MTAIYVVVTVITSLANAGIAGADLAHARFVLANMDEVGVPRSVLPLLAALKIAGAVGLAMGPTGIATDHRLLQLVGVAAAVGLTLFYLGAVATHLRTRVLHNIAYPGTYLLLAAASLCTALLV